MELTREEIINGVSKKELICLCAYCLKPTFKRYKKNGKIKIFKPLMHDEATKEHLIPRSRCEKGLRNNVITVCFQCNQEKGNMLLEEWIVSRLVKE